jgi:hypothetical protein
MRDAPPLYTIVGQLVGWTLDRTADFPKSRRFTFGQRLDNLSLDCLQQAVRAMCSERNAAWHQPKTDRQILGRRAV